MAHPVRRLAFLLGLPVVIGGGPAQVIDGDTLDLAGERTRLWGIDAVEGDQVCQRKGQPWQCGDIAARALEPLVYDRERRMKTYIGRLGGMRKSRGPSHKMKVLSLVERGGEVRSIKVESVSRPTVEKIVKANVARESRLMTDEPPYYPRVGTQFAGHESVNHSHDEWARGEAHTNTIEGVFSIFKRGMRGVYQHCSEKHLHRYLAEFDFRYNNGVTLGVDDQRRASRTLGGIKGKRLTYKHPIS
jgi:hypothetical protein